MKQTIMLTMGVIYFAGLWYTPTAQSAGWPVYGSIASPDNLFSTQQSSTKRSHIGEAPINNGTDNSAFVFVQDPCKRVQSYDQFPTDHIASTDQGMYRLAVLSEPVHNANVLKQRPNQPRSWWQWIIACFCKRPQESASQKTT